MTSRFISNLTVLLAGAFLVAASLGFGAGALAWLALGMGCVVVVTVLWAFARRGRGIAQRALDAVILVAGAWTIVASRTFHGSTLMWLVFAAGALLTTLAFAALIVHEALLELAVRRAAGPSNGRAPSLGERPASVGAAR